MRHSDELAPSENMSTTSAEASPGNRTPQVQDDKVGATVMPDHVA